MHATTMLRAHHGDISLALNILESVCNNLSKNQNPSVAHLDQLFDFLTSFVQNSHFTLEEEVLFPALEMMGVQRSGGAMETASAEHRACAEQLGALLAAADAFRQVEADARDRMVSAGRALVEKLRAHLAAEESAILPLVDKALNEAMQRRLAERMQSLEASRLSPKSYATYHDEIDKLKNAYIRV